MNRNKITQKWLAGWLEKMSIVTIFNGLFNASVWSFCLGVFCIFGSMYLTIKSEGDE